MAELHVASFPGASVYVTYDDVTRLITGVRSLGHVMITLDNGLSRRTIELVGQTVAVPAALGLSVDLVAGKERGPLAISTSWSP